MSCSAALRSLLQSITDLSVSLRATHCMRWGFERGGQARFIFVGFVSFIRERLAYVLPDCLPFAWLLSGLMVLSVSLRAIHCTGWKLERGGRDEGSRRNPTFEKDSSENPGRSRRQPNEARRVYVGVGFGGWHLVPLSAGFAFVGSVSYIRGCLACVLSSFLPFVALQVSRTSACLWGSSVALFLDLNGSSAGGPDLSD